MVINDKKAIPPSGAVVIAGSAGAYIERGHLRNPKTKHLDDIRNYNNDQGKLVKPRARTSLPPLGSKENVEQFHKDMQALRARIDDINTRVSKLDETAKRSNLKKLVASITDPFKVCVLSAMNDEQDLKGAMRAPKAKNTQKSKKKYTHAELLGTHNIQTRNASLLKERSLYLQERADGQYQHGPEARETEFKARLAFLEQTVEDLEESLAGLDTAIKNLDDGQKDLDGLQARKDQLIVDLNKELTDLQNRLQQLPEQIKSLENESLILRQEIDGLVPKVEEAEMDGLKRLSLLGQEGTATPRGQTISEELGRLDAHAKTLKQQILAKTAAIENNSNKIDNCKQAEEQAKQREAAIPNEIAQLKNKDGEVEQAIAAARERQTDLQKTCNAAVVGLEDFIEHLEKGKDTGTYQQLSKRLVDVCVDHGNDATNDGSAKSTLALGSKVRELLDGEAKTFRSEIQDEDSNLAQDLKAAKENQRVAKELVAKLDTYIENVQEGVTDDQSAVARKIEKLEGFDGDAVVRLRGELELLDARLTHQPAPEKDELSNKTVFDLVYQAACGLRPDPLTKPDPGDVADVLAEISRPELTLSDLMGDEPGLSKDAQRLLQSLAVLPRGMEVLTRIIADDIGYEAHFDVSLMTQAQKVDGDADDEDAAQTEKQHRLDARKKIEALQTCLRAGNDMSKLERNGMINKSTKELLDLARGAAKKVFADPHVKLGYAERAAYSAVINRLTQQGTGPKSHIQKLAERIVKVPTQWVPLALERGESLAGRIGQGIATGLGAITNLSPKTGKTPFGGETLKAVDRTATGYASHEFAISGVRLDAQVNELGTDLRKAVVGLLRSGARFDDMEQLLINVAAADVARDQMTEAANSGRGLRPEHCVVGGPLSRQEIMDIVHPAVERAFKAATLPVNETRIKEITAAVSDALNSAMLNSRTKDDLVTVAINAASESMQNLQAGKKDRRAFLDKFDITGEMDEIAKAEGQPDFDAVKAKLLQLKDDAGLDDDEPGAALIDRIADQLVYPLHATASQPFKAENLIQCNKDLKQCAADADPGDDVKALVKEVERRAVKLGQFIDDSPAPTPGNKDELYNYLAARIEQIEIPGRMRLMSGGVTGFTSKGVSDSISTTRWGLGLIGVAPKPRLDKIKGSNAAFELIFSSVGMELWLVSEKKQFTAKGFGIGGSAGIPWAKGGLSVDKAWINDETVHEGVKLMVPRSRVKEYSEDEMREEVKDLLYILVYGHPREITDDTPEIEEQDGEVPGLPPMLVAVLATCPHLSPVVLDTMTDKYKKQETYAGGWGSLREPMEKKRAVGATHTFGGKNVRLDERKYNISESTGRVGVERNNVAHGGHRTLNSTLGPTATLAEVGNNLATQAIGASLPGLVGSKQVSVAGADVKLRLASREGRMDPDYTRREFEYTTVEALRKNIEADYEAWIQTGVHLLFLDEERADFPPEKKTPIEKKRAYAIETIEAALKTCEEAERNPSGEKNLRHVFAETYRLRDAATSQLDGFRSMEVLEDARIEELEHYIANLKKDRSSNSATVKAAKAELKNARQDKARLIEAKNAIYQQDASWMPWKISATERTFEKREKGGDLLLKAGVTDIAETQRPVFFWPY